MRQVLDTLVWLAVICVVAAVVYFTPRLAQSFAWQKTAHGQVCGTCRDMASFDSETSDTAP
jgi:hypothetical protein